MISRPNRAALGKGAVASIFHVRRVGRGAPECKRWTFEAVACFSVPDSAPLKLDEWRGKLQA